tara:strand:- start:3892 stop:4185 length:294 start_codon:yes stop_codon:yes gene_type:complete
MKYRLAKFDDAVAAHVALGGLVDDPSRALQVTAFAQCEILGPPDPETGAVPILAPAVLTDGFWVLFADPDGDETIVLPPGLAAIAPLFAGMNMPVAT